MPVVALILLVLLVLAIIVCGPLLVIWSLNTLFAFSIPFTLKTWFATMILSTVVGGTRYVNKNS